VNRSPAGDILRAINLAAAFALELCMLAAFGYWGSVLPAALPWRIGTCVAVPLAVAATWAVLAAPCSAHRLPPPWLTLLKVALFALAALALAAAGRRGLGALLFGTALANLALAMAWKQVGVTGARVPAP
jgi:hypothetical protein